MNKNSKIYVAGHRGLVGSALIRALVAKGYNNILVRTHSELDLLSQKEVSKFFEDVRPEYVFLAAAKVGGILSNSKYPADFIYQNIQIEANVIQSSHKCGVKKLLFLGSSCIYPKMSKQPIKEEYLLTGPLEYTNEAYAVAKIAGLMMCRKYKEQYGDNFISAMPTNIYGVNDNFHPEDSHVIPGLIRRIFEAKRDKKSSVKIWGSGSPKREFLYVDDLAYALIIMMENYNGLEHLNVGTGIDITIKELSELIKKIIGYQGELIFDKEKPDGTPRKLLDVSKLKSMGWVEKFSLEEGLRLTIDWFENSFSKK